MIEVKDLNIEKEIIPLFDHTNNRYSRNILRNLFTPFPNSIDNIYERQLIIKGLIFNWDKIHQFYYRELEVEEVYRSFEDILSGRLIIEENKIKSRIQYYLVRREKLQKQSAYIQMIYFFERIYINFFSVLDLKPFPDDFKKRISKINQFLESLDLKNHASIIRDKGLSVSHIIKIDEIIINKIHNGDVSTFWDFFFLFDAYFSIARTMKESEFEFPVFTKSGILIENFYHPQLKDPVKNSITTAGNIVLITGPNMSGKSTLLKSLGLCVYLGHIGLPVPASKCEIPYFDGISIVINTEDNIIKGYSHFMAEIKKLRQVVEGAASGKRYFAVFDELFRGTNFEDALEITEITIRGIQKFENSYFFISTHLYQLSNILDINDRNIELFHVECLLNMGVPLFSFRLQKGWSDMKIGKILFEREGMVSLLSSPK